jgi:hypothetical protein
MKITKTAKLKITSHTNIFKETLSIYNKALSFYIRVCEKEYSKLLELGNSKEKLNYIEAITHRTSKNTNIKYDFSEEFYKYPSYLRRSTIMEAIGVCDSHFSRLKLYKEKKENKIKNNKKFYEKPPTLNYEPKSFPVFYKDNMWNKISDGKGKIKLYKNNDWVWVEIDYKANELLSGKMFRFSGYKELNPSLVQKGKKYFLHIPYQTEIKLNSTSLKQQRVIGVDLGLTNSAVCSCIDYNGTVIDRKFINQSIEKDRLKTAINKLAKAKRESGILNEKPKLWRKINNLQKFIIQNNADVVVFEYLGKMRLPKHFFGARRLRAKLQFWAKSKIQDLSFKKAHSKSIRYSKVLARGTSMYAFDGSGLVKRSKKKDIAKFKNNKMYHADLSASYNIASRYFTRAILKPLSEKARLDLEAKVSLLSNRTSHTLSSLIKLHEVSSIASIAEVSRIQDKEAPPIAISIA